MEDFIVSPTTWIIFVALVIFTTLTLLKKTASIKELKKYSVYDAELAKLPQAPGPRQLPFIGNLIQLNKYAENPYAGFTVMAKEYGPVFRLRIGNQPCIVVSSMDSIKEVLIKKSDHFDARPNFYRWNLYFDGDRQHSLALCDWSEKQKTRRNIIRKFLILKPDCHRFDKLERHIQTEMESLLTQVAKQKERLLIKVPISYCAINIFMRYMCSMNFKYSDIGFQKITEYFDHIFEDINNGHPTDFFPSLAPYYQKYGKEIRDWAVCIRSFILDSIIKDRPEKITKDGAKDLLDALLLHYKEPEDGKESLDWKNVLFALEDLLGGSSAISNTIVRCLGHIAQTPTLQTELQNEIDAAIGESNIPCLADRASMPLLEATILETIRYSSSPIVPHVASEDTSLGGYSVEKGTIIFLNNYCLNTSPELWQDPESFQPQRFLKNNQICRPSFFLPFSTGKRMCVGSRILVNVVFMTIAYLMQKYELVVPEDEVISLPKGKLSLAFNGFEMTLKERRRA